MRKYKDYRIGPYVFTVELWLRKCCENAEVRMRIWDYHTPPRNIFQWVKRAFTVKYYETHIWSYDITSIPLDAYVVKACNELVNSADCEIKTKQAWANFN